MTPTRAGAHPEASRAAAMARGHPRDPQEQPHDHSFLPLDPSRPRRPGGVLPRSVAVEAGSMMIMQPGSPHFAFTTGETVVQLHGNGPWGGVT